MLKQQTLVSIQSSQETRNRQSQLGRGSVFMGVSKNGEHWQVMINCGKDKKYIGTYLSEKEAAIAYDFYSICLHESKAKTNFSYDAGMVSRMVENYKRNLHNFTPAEFIDQV
uniref:AP2/ERF domain-containing protein n=1 Tax=Euplotes harpa TaxID=151035 RepID=A0A7S3N8K2_9SPIT|mmetsp:Transcript_33885/g.39119  ORF Transcript_33885/g.39119 Transcript_33885/m.39119 type:complete len:112 (+) Transcript_33885:573-908(+)